MEIPPVFKTVFGYNGVIDGAPQPSIGPDGPMDWRTSIFTHFLKDDSMTNSNLIRSSVVPGSEIMNILEDPETVNKLMTEFRNKDLFLSSLSSNDTPEQKNEMEPFVWALVGVSAVLLVLLIAGAFVYYVKFS
ncbi:unnamed protein product, partial [Darwinula stevensoni]